MISFIIIVNSYGAQPIKNEEKVKLVYLYFFKGNYTYFFKVTLKLQCPQTLKSYN